MIKSIKVNGWLIYNLKILNGKAILIVKMMMLKKYLIKLIKIFAFRYMLCFFYNSFLNQCNICILVPRFSNCFKEINGYFWESSEINILLLIKLYGIYLISKLDNIKNYQVMLYIFALESTLLFTFKKSSLIIHTIISMIFYQIFKINLKWI